MADGNISDELRDVYLGHAIDLERVSASERKRILALLEKVGEEIDSQIQDANLQGKSGSAKVARLEALRREINATIARSYQEMSTASQDYLVELARYVEQKTVKSINDVVTVEVASVTLTPGTLQTIVSKTLIEGHPASVWWRKQSDDLQRNFIAQMRMGLVAGETNDQLVRRIRGSYTGKSIQTTDLKGNPIKVKEFQGGIMDASRREAMALVRTSAQAVSNKTNLAAFDGNKDLLRGYQALVTLDTRTTLLCMSRSGGAWDLDGKPLPQSRIRIPFPGPPPWHWNCRTVLIPLLKSWEELIADAGRKLKAKLRSTPEGTQSSMNGQVAGDLSYQEWLKTQSEDVQKEALGAGRFALFKAGKIKSFSQLVDQTGRDLTLEELSRRL